MTDIANKKILDPCCGSRMFWFDRQRPDVLFGDVRNESYILCDGRRLDVNPDVRIDFTSLPFRDNSFKLVVFDPPHLKNVGGKSWMAKKYGKLVPTWKNEISNGFSECFRVLRPEGILIFKWNEIQIKTSEILKLTDIRPLFGHLSGRSSKTHWICFMNT